MDWRIELKSLAVSLPKNVLCYSKAIILSSKCHDMFLALYFSLLELFAATVNYHCYE